MSKCNSCGAEIIWAKTQSGKHMPLDAKPQLFFQLGLSERDLIESRISDAGDRRDGDAVDRLSEEWEAADTRPTCRTVQVHTSHFATCPDADHHRKAR